ncbi:MAG: hypothetical protein ACFCVC_00695 [Acidimicrobiia bacterium]
MEPVALRPLNFGEVLDTSFNLFKRNFKAVVLVSGAIMIPLSLLGAAAAAGLAPSDLSALDDPNADVEDILGLFGGLLGAIGLGSLLQIVGSILVQAATTRIYAESYRGGSMSAGDALRHGLGRLPGMLGLTLLTTIGSFIGIILCIAPGVWLYAAWGLAPAALIAEPTSPIKALGRSFNLVKGNWWRVFGLLLLAAVLVAIISGTVTAPLQFGATFGAGFAENPAFVLSGTFVALNTLVTGLVTAVTLPFTAAVVVAIYYDLRVRKEGYDLERLIADLGAAPDAPAPPTANPSDPFGLG